MQKVFDTFTDEVDRFAEEILAIYDTFGGSIRWLVDECTGITQMLAGIEGSPLYSEHYQNLVHDILNDIFAHAMEVSTSASFSGWKLIII